MIVRILEEASDEAVEAAAWYDRQRLGLGDEFLAAIDEAFQKIGQSPETLSGWEDYPGPHACRRILLNRFPYAVTFVIRPSTIWVIAVSHTRRQPYYWLPRIERMGE